VPPIGFGVVRIRKTTDSKSKRRVAKKKVMSLGKVRCISYIQQNSKL